MDQLNERVLLISNTARALYNTRFQQIRAQNNLFSARHGSVMWSCIDTVEHVHRLLSIQQDLFTCYQLSIVFFRREIKTLTLKHFPFEYFRSLPSSFVAVLVVSSFRSKCNSKPELVSIKELMSLRLVTKDNHDKIMAELSAIYLQWGKPFKCRYLLQHLSCFSRAKMADRTTRQVNYSAVLRC